MDKSLSQTPAASRTHIGFFGRMNAGKSSLINLLTNQPVSIVSDQPGTTTDVVKKAMEIHGIGPCVLLDTAGFDDASEVGAMRVKASRNAAQSTDVAVVLFGGDEDIASEKEWIRYFEDMSTPVVCVLTHADLRSEEENKRLAERIGAALEGDSGAAGTEVSGAVRAGSSGAAHEIISVSAVTGEGAEALKDALIRAVSRTAEKQFIMGNLVSEGDVVMLVMPQDPQAPEGRLILPEVQTIREALDRKCISVCVQPDEMEAALSALKEPPALIVTDSQVFDRVYAMKPEKSKLTSFSVLFAGYKGDISYYMESAKAIETLTENSRVLIAECCTHAPLDEDIGRKKIPAMLRRRVGEKLRVDVTAGKDFPEDLSVYDLVIQCGGCMFNRKYVCSRIQKAKDAGVPMTNYGITIAHVKGILDRVETGRD